MGVEKLSVSFDPDLGRAIRQSAEDDDESVSAWLAEAARQRLRTLALGDAIDELLVEFDLTEAEVLEAATEARRRAVRVKPHAKGRS